MRSLHHEFPYYGWHTNKGYGTGEHCKAIEAHGICKYHRKTFSMRDAQISLFEENI
jgi:ribonuclease HII